MIVLLLLAAAHLVASILFYPPDLAFAPGTWGSLEHNRQGAILIEAAGSVASAATLWLLWVFADPLAFAAMMTFGVLAVRVLADWTVVLYLISARDAER